jgi:hypothetical protein
VRIGTLRGFGNPVRSGAPLSARRSSDGHGESQNVSGVFACARSKKTVGASLPHATRASRARYFFFQTPSVE